MARSHHRSIPGALALLVLAGCAAGEPAAQPPPRGPRASKVRWAADFEAARATRKPVLVCFLAAGCHPCEELEDALEDGEVLAMLDGFACVREDVSKAPGPLYRRLGLTNHPAVALYGPSGEELDSRDYGPAKRELLRLLRAASR